MREHSRITVAVSGLGCGGGGAEAIERMIRRVPGVVAAYVNPATETAYVDVDARRCNVGDVYRAVEAAGYRVGVPTNNLTSTD